MKTIHALQQEEVAVDAEDPASASRPFDRDRQGAVLGEGAGVLILENLAQAQARGAKILAEVLGVGTSAVAASQCVANRHRAMAQAMKSALSDANMAPDSVGHINSHGLSTR
jgi:3-oxoacyl-[acyl-carrier-protein] synthase II